VSGDVDAQRVDGLILSPAEQVGVLLWGAAYHAAHGVLPAEVPIRPLLGPASAPPHHVAAAAQEPHTLALEGLATALRQADAEASISGMVPSTVHANGGLSPATALRAAAAYLLAVSGAGAQAPPTALTVQQGAEEPVLARRPDIADYTFGGWSILPPGFRGERVRAMARLQAWTAKPAAGRV
jgi:hypothetical protein